MQEKFINSHFALLYVWMAKAKYTMGLFFIVFVHMYLLFGWIHTGMQTTLDLITSLEMVIACFLIGVTQQIIVPRKHLTIKRAVVWILLGFAITLSFSIIFQWFAKFPAIYLQLFLSIVIIGMAAMILNYYFELIHETDKLNKQLVYFQGAIKTNGERKDD